MVSTMQSSASSRWDLSSPIFLAVLWKMDGRSSSHFDAAPLHFVQCCLLFRLACWMFSGLPVSSRLLAYPCSPLLPCCVANGETTSETDFEQRNNTCVYVMPCSALICRSGRHAQRTLCFQYPPRVVGALHEESAELELARHPGGLEYPTTAKLPHNHGFQSIKELYFTKIST